MSPIYGDSKERLDSLRGSRGTMLINDARVLKERPNCTEACYETGDVRVNQTPPLALLHSLPLRFHNFCAENLAKLNPWWSSDRIFDESRKINIAVWQHIIYEHWLPLMLGKCDQYLHSSALMTKCGSFEINRKERVHRKWYIMWWLGWKMQSIWSVGEASHIQWIPAGLIPWVACIYTKIYQYLWEQPFCEESWILQIIGPYYHAK